MEYQGSFAIELNLQTQQTRKLSIDQLEIDPSDLDRIYWIHADLSQANEFEQLKNKLKFSEELIELCAENELRAKLKDSSDSLTLLLQCPLSSFLDTAGQTPVDNLIIHLTAQYCFTASGAQTLAVKELLQEYPKAVPYAKTPCFVLFLLLDLTLNAFSDLLYEYQLLTEKIDINIKNTDYAEVIEIKRQLMKNKRYIAAIRDILMRISGRKIAVISEACRMSLQKILPHGEIMVHEADSIRDLFHTMLDQIDNALMQQVNITMKVLTGFAAIFLPLTLITGIYGMNFHWIPELEWKYGYFWALGLMLGAGIGLYLFFKKKGWF